MWIFDRFFDWWPLAALLSLGGIAQLMSSLWPKLKGPRLVGAVVAVFAVLFGIWMLAAPQHSPFGRFASGAHAEPHHAHRSSVSAAR